MMEITKEDAVGGSWGISRGCSRGPKRVRLLLFWILQSQVEKQPNNSTRTWDICLYRGKLPSTAGASSVCPTDRKFTKQHAQHVRGILSV